MKSFYQFYQQIADESYAKYTFQNYMSNSILNGTENGTHDLKELTPEDMKSYAMVDVVDWYKKYGRNLTKLGPAMSDDEYRKFQGIH
jgi:hypothetical protein